MYQIQQLQEKKVRDEIGKQFLEREGQKTILLSRIEAADLLGVKVNTLAVWAMKGIGPAPTKIGRCVKYRLDILADFITNNTMPRGKGGSYE